jgi:glycosyltransferase involved in cell wall biosynthesis
MDVASTTTPHPTATTRPSVLYVITKSQWGGAQRYVYDVASAAHHDGYAVTVALGSAGELSARLEQAGITTVLIPGLMRDISLTGDVAALRALIALIRTTKPTVVHGNSSKAGLLAMIAARYTGIPIRIFTAHGWAFNETRPAWQKIIFAFFHFVTAYTATRVLCVSEGVYRDAQWMPLPKDRCKVIHLGISAPPQLTKDAARSLLAPAFSYPFWIGTLAELHPTKGLDYALRAFAAIAEEFPMVGLILIGEGQARNELTELARSLNIEHRIHFCGRVPDAATTLSALDLFLFPSRSEALGYALLEAGYARLPAIGSNVGGIPEILRPNDTGILVPVGDISAITSTLRTLILDEKTRKGLGESLYTYVSTEFSRETMITKTFAQYASLKRTS